jgi:ribosome-associated protein
MRKISDGTDLLLKSVVKGIFEKQGQDVLKIDLRKIESRIADYYVICHGSSKTQVDSISYSVEDTARKEAGEKPLHVEGHENCFWVLVDYGDVVVHIFQEEYRNFYSLESLWADAVVEKLKDVKTEVAKKRVVKSKDTKTRVTKTRVIKKVSKK